MEQITITHGNGYSTTYKISKTGTAYHLSTPDELINILETVMKERQRVKIYYGDPATGKDWAEDYDKYAYIGRSAGKIKVPLSIATKRSNGGGALMDHCIVKLKDMATGKILYQAENYKAPVFCLIPSTSAGYTHSVTADGELISNHKTEREAQRLIKKLS